MYKAKYQRKEIIINNKDYNKILRRFDVKNFKLIDTGFGTYYKNDTPCPLCIKYDDCDSCPFNVINFTGVEPCMAFIYSAFKGSKLKYRRNFPTISYDAIVISDPQLQSCDEKFHILKIIHSLFKNKFQKV